MPVSERHFYSLDDQLFDADTGNGTIDVPHLNQEYLVGSAFRAQHTGVSLSPEHMFRLNELIGYVDKVVGVLEDGTGSVEMNPAQTLAYPSEISFRPFSGVYSVASDYGRHNNMSDDLLVDQLSDQNDQEDRALPASRQPAGKSQQSHGDSTSHGSLVSDQSPQSSDLPIELQLFAYFPRHIRHLKQGEGELFNARADSGLLYSASLLSERIAVLLGWEKDRSLDDISNLTDLKCPNGTKITILGRFELVTKFKRNSTYFLKKKIVFHVVSKDHDIGDCLLNAKLLCRYNEILRMSLGRSNL